MMGNHLALRTEGKKHYDPRNVRIVRSKFACCKKDDISDDSISSLIEKYIEKRPSLTKEQIKELRGMYATLSEKDKEIFKWFLKRDAEHKVRVHLDERDIDVPPRTPGQEEVKASELSKKDKEVWDWFLERKAKHKVRVFLDEEEIEAISPRTPGTKEAVGDGSAIAVKKDAQENPEKTEEKASDEEHQTLRWFREMEAELKVKVFLDEEKAEEISRRLNPLGKP